MAAPFLIFNASAGAGKTYRLVRHYLKLCLQSRDSMAFMHILAITFTNKAANEMKSRLVKQLRILEEYPNLKEKELEYCYSLAEEMGLKPEELKYRAAESLASILHNYSAFAVSTIDRFTNRLIRSFSRELKLSSNYQIEMRSDLILEEAIDQVLDDLDGRSPFSQLLSEYIEQQLASEKSPDTKSLLKELGKELFKERALEAIEVLAKMEASDFVKIKGTLSERLEAIEAEHLRLASELLNFCEQHNIEKRSFGDPNLWGRLLKMKAGEFIGFTTKTITQLNDEAEALLPKKTRPEAEALAPHTASVQDWLKEIQAFFESQVERRELYRQVLQRLAAMAVLSEIERKLQVVKEESNRLPIGEFNKIISQELRQQPAPFIYEKMGERYQHFFIDEFQDTSTLQWQNMLPLINNALASEGASALIVGDAKQSIYRFRGGELQLFIDLFQNRDPSNRQGDLELYQRETIMLANNFRSLANIVEFNNKFFAQSAQMLALEEHRELYAAARQEPAGKPGGYVGFHLLDKDNFKKEQLEFLIPLLNNLFKRGYEQKDICLLARSNKEGKEAAQFLLQAQALIKTPQEKVLQILSADSLVVGSSPAVRALVSFLQMMEQPANYEWRKDWLLYAYSVFGEGHEEEHQFLSRYRELSIAEALEMLQAYQPEFEAAHWQSQDLIQQLYSLAKAFKMPWQDDPYLQFFLDQAQDYLKNQRPIAQEFLDWWNEDGKEESVSLPESVDALQVMSIHKSKGLEFPVVICLKVDQSLDSELSKSNDWLKLEEVEEIDFAGLPYAYLKFNNPVAAEHQKIYSRFRERERAKVMLDRLNMLYVAFTRAEAELHIISPVPPKSNPEKHIQSALMQFFEAELPGSYFYGEELHMSEVKAENTQQYSNVGYDSISWYTKIEAISSAPLNWQKPVLEESRWGKQVHQLLSALIYPSDLTKVITQARREAWFESGEIDTLTKQMQQLLRIPDLEPLFSEEVEVYNERSLLLEDGRQRIPDRLVRQGKNWYIADYKSGLPRPEHRNQVNEYKAILEQAGHQVAQCYLIYLNEEEIAVERW